MATAARQILTPTDDLSEREVEQNNGFHHLLPRFRQGSVSFEVFDRRKREVLGFSEEGARKEYDDAREEQEATKMGVRGQGSQVGAEASLRQQANPATEKTEEAVKKARSRKKAPK